MGDNELSEEDEPLRAAIIAVVVFDVCIIALFSSNTIQPQISASQFKIITGKSVRTKVFFMADSFEAVLASHADAGSSVLSIHHVVCF